MANYLSNAEYDTVMSGKMHFIGPDQLHGFNRRLTTDIYSSDFNWVKQEWIDIKKNQGHDYDEVMSNRQAYNAKGYTGEGVHIGQWHNALSYDEETHFRSLEYLRARGNKPEPFMLVASYHHPHEPFHAPHEYWDLYEGAEIEIPEFPDNLDETYSMMDRCLNAYHGTRRSLQTVRPRRSLQTAPRLLRPSDLYGPQGWRIARYSTRNRPGRQYCSCLRQRPRRHALRKRDGAETLFL